MVRQDAMRRFRKHPVAPEEQFTASAENIPVQSTYIVSRYIGAELLEFQTLTGSRGVILAAMDFASNP